MTGEALHDQLDQGGYLAVYGRRDYDHRTAGVYDRSVAIVGIRRPNGWKIYAQKKGRMTHDIRSVHRIYPPE